MEQWREELYHSEFYNELHLEHHGILGQKWGVRRKLNKLGHHPSSSIKTKKTKKSKIDEYLEDDF